MCCMFALSITTKTHFMTVQLTQGFQQLSFPDVITLLSFIRDNQNIEYCLFHNENVKNDPMEFRRGDMVDLCFHIGYYGNGCNDYHIDLIMDGSHEYAIICMFNK